MKLVVRVQAVSERREFSRWLESKIFEKFGIRPSFARLAQQADLTQGTLNSIIKGMRFPTVATADKLAKLLELDPMEVKRRAGLVPLFDSESRPSLTEEEKKEVVAALQHSIDSLS